MPYTLRGRSSNRGERNHEDDRLYSGKAMHTLLLIGALAAVPAIPTVSGPVTPPGMMYPNPPVSMVATAKKVEDFPYITEEYLVSGTANGAPYTTRIIVR